MGTIRDKISHPAIPAAVVVGLLLSVFFVLGKVLFERQYLYSFGMRDFAFCVLVWIIISIAVYGLFRFCDYTFSRPDKYVNRIAVVPRNRFILMLALFVFVCWLPFWLAAWPGVFSYDAPHQLWQFVNGNIRNNQPVASSFILYAVMSIGKAVSGSWEGGLAFYIFAQMAFGAFTMAYMCILVLERTRSTFFFVLCLVFACFHPMNQLFIVNAAKDVLYAYLVAWVIMLLSEASINQYAFFRGQHRKRKCILLAMFIFLFLLYRNNSIYSLLLLAPFLMWYFKSNIKIISLILVAVLVPYFVLTGPVYGYFGVQNDGNAEEALSVPFQQISNVYVKYGDGLNEEDTARISALFPQVSPKDLEALYETHNADPVKSFVEINRSFKEMGWANFLRLWIDLGLQHPQSYLEAFLNNTLGYWYPGYQYSEIGSDRYIEYNNSTYQYGIHINRAAVLPSLGDYCYGIGEKYYFGLPLKLKMLLSPAATIYTLVILLGYSIYRNARASVIPQLAICTIAITLLGGPLMLMRYVYPMALSIPIILSVVGLEANDGKSESEALRGRVLHTEE